MTFLRIPAMYCPVCNAQLRLIFRWGVPVWEHGLAPQCPRSEKRFRVLYEHVELEEL